ncbi:MAG: hypothetical protein U0U66_12885 [Cytophagaceae bacterium]
MSFLHSRFFWIIAVIILIAELLYATKQYSHTKVDGDFAAIVLPAEWYTKVLEDPLGKSALLDKERYGATNRFTSHYVMHSYFYHVPLLLQKFTNPIESVYLAITIAKLFIHIMFLALVGYYAASFSGFLYKKWLFAMVIISPFLISHGAFIDYYSFLDKTITYAMFYTLPLCTLMLYYIPIYYFSYLKKHPLPKGLLLVYIPISLFMVSFGPLTAPLIIIINGLIFGFLLLDLTAIGEKRNITIRFSKLVATDKILLTILCVGFGFSFYSLYLGSFNIENDSCTISIIDRYKGLVKGIYYSFFGYKEGGLYLVVFLGFVLWLSGKKFIQENLFIILLFSILLIAAYCFLLPLGGCRDYRPYILRRDTFLPALSVLLFLVSTCSVYILEQKNTRVIITFLIPWIIISIFYWSKDSMPVWYDDNELEKKNLYQLQSSTDDCTTLNEGLSVFSWNNYSECNQSRVSSELLLHYRIIDRYRLYKNHE